VLYVTLVGAKCSQPSRASPTPPTTPPATPAGLAVKNSEVDPTKIGDDALRERFVALRDAGVEHAFFKAISEKGGECWVAGCGCRRLQPQLNGCGDLPSRHLDGRAGQRCTCWLLTGCAGWHLALRSACVQHPSAVYAASHTLHVTACQDMCRVIEFYTRDTFER